MLFLLQPLRAGLGKEDRLFLAYTFPNELQAFGNITTPTDIQASLTIKKFVASENCPIKRRNSQHQPHCSSSPILIQTRGNVEEMKLLHSELVL